MQVKRWKKRLVFAAVLFLCCAVAVAAHAAPRPQKERSLGGLSMGDLEVVVQGKLGELKPGDPPGVFVSGNWRIWITPDTRIVHGISYDERSGINAKTDYPRTGRGITVGSAFTELVSIYGKPEKTFTGKSAFLARNSELALIAVYPSKGFWAMLTNQKPYSGASDWRVTLLAVGDERMFSRMMEEIPSYAATPIDKKERARIQALYRKQFGSPKDLDIYDDYLYNLQSAYFDHVRSLGTYAITPLTVIPASDAKRDALLQKLLADSPLSKKLDTQARSRTRGKYSIAPAEFERIENNIPPFRKVLFRQGLIDKKWDVMKSLQLPEGQCK